MLLTLETQRSLKVIPVILKKTIGKTSFFFVLDWIFFFLSFRYYVIDFVLFLRKCPVLLCEEKKKRERNAVMVFDRKKKIKYQHTREIFGFIKTIATARQRVIFELRCRVVRTGAEHFLNIYMRCFR